MKQVLIAALRRDGELLPKVAGTLRGRIEEKDGPMSTFVHAAEALEPVLAEAVRKRPSRLGELGLKSAHLLAGLAVEDQTSNSRLARIAEGGTVGITFVDVAGFTTLTEERGDGVAIRLLSRLARLVQKTLPASKGEEVKRLGDGFLLAYPSASQAVRGAVALRDAVEKERVRDSRFDLQIRIAVHAGEPLIEEGDLLGHDVNLTARLLDHCAAGEVIVSAAATEQAARRLRKVSFGNERVVKIRGLSTPVIVYSVDP
ncbi:MAG: adenylate/guanylate cyclase domain-containing protein [Actinomycetota bacterium]|nr:adenylate/guanylate cyclase domain-containing protein [Actinomycetota bacterium]